MNPPLQTIRLSKREVDLLNILKRRTKILQWNVLCRMAICLSCADANAPQPLTETRMDGSVELDWATFGGEYAELYSGLILQHSSNNGDSAPLGDYFRRLLYRGILKLKEKY